MVTITIEMLDLERNKISVLLPNIFAQQPKLNPCELQDCCPICPKALDHSLPRMPSVHCQPLQKLDTDEILPENVSWDTNKLD